VSYTYIILFVLIALVILVVAIVLFTAITGDYRKGLRLREELAQRLRYLRLDKMLSKRNIKRENYLHLESISNIETQIRTCESCSLTEQCDQALKEGSPADLSYCPLNDDLELIANRVISNSKE
jgi:hypothetical protein